MKPDPLTYAQLMADQAQLVTLGQLNPQTAANRATALRLFLHANSVQLDDVVGMEMRPHFPLSVDRLVATLREQGRSERSISNTRSALTAWKRAVIAADTARAHLQSQLSPFIEAIKQAIDGHPIERTARQAGVSRDMLFGWLRGKIPRPSNAMHIRRLEGFFGLERESLVKLAGIVDGQRARPQVGESHEIEYRQTLGARTQDEYFLEVPEHSPLREQWRQLIRYKTALVPTLKRSSGGRWTFAPLDVIRATESNWASFLDGVEVPSAGAVWNTVASYLGWMALPADRGGPGLPVETLQTLAWLAVPDFIEPYLDWQKKRAGGRRSKGTTELFSLVACMVRAKVGYLHQQPAFLKTLPMSFQNEDWSALCERQLDYVTQLTRALTPELGSTRDPFEPIRSIIDLPQPLEAIADMIQRLRRDRPMGSAISEAIWARDVFMVKLFISNPLRLRNMAALTWTRANVDGRRPDDQGSLYQKGDGSWWLFVPKRLLKNRRAKVINEYDSPVHASVWGDLERYLLRHRDVLTRWPTDLVFIAQKRDPARVKKVKGGDYKLPPQVGHRPFMDMTRRLFLLTRRYLWKSDGAASHAFRHIVATAILKTESGDIKTAALVLNDSEATVALHYSGMRSGDGAVRMGKLLGKTLNRM